MLKHNILLSFCLGLIMLNSINSFKRVKSFRYNLNLNNFRNLQKIYVNQKNVREFSSSDILRCGNDTNYAAQWQSKGDFYLSLDKLDLLNRKLMSYENSLTRKAKGEVLRDVSLTYFARFHNLIRKEYQFENLRDWFQALYQVLLGQDQGPRFGSFVALYGLDDSIKLIKRALAGEDLSA